MQIWYIESLWKQQHLRATSSWKISKTLPWPLIWEPSGMRNAMSTASPQTWLETGIIIHYQETVSMRRLPQRIQTRARLIRSTKETNIQISIHQFRISIHNHINNIQLVCMFFNKKKQVTALSTKNDSNFLEKLLFWRKRLLELLGAELGNVSAGHWGNVPPSPPPRDLTLPGLQPFLGFPSFIGNFCTKKQAP